MYLILVDSIANKNTQSSLTSTPEKKINGNGVADKSPEDQEQSYIPKPQEQSQEDEESAESEEKQESGISAIRFKDLQATIPEGEKYDEEHLASMHGVKQMDSGARQTYLTEKLKQSLESVAPLLREIMADFRSFLQKTLLGTHGQEIMNDAKGNCKIENKIYCF
jgi:hypothetical protein